MRVALSIEVTEPQRTALTGKKRPATRDEVRDFVLGCLASLTAEPSEDTSDPTPPPAQSEQVTTGGSASFLSRLTATERKTYNKLIAKGHPPAYAQGWIKGGRVLKHTTNAK